MPATIPQPTVPLDRIRQEPIRALILDPEDALDEPYQGWIIAHSRSNIFLAVKQPWIKPGTALKVATVSDSDGLPWMEVEVRRGRRKGNWLQLECEFTYVDYSWKMVLLD